MEIIEKNNSPKMGVLGVALFAAGAALLTGSLLRLPDEPAYGFPWAFSLSVLSFLLISAGGWCLGTMVMRRRDASWPYGRDHGHGSAIPFAFVVIAAGIMLLAFNSGVLPWEWKRVFFSVQMLLLVFSMNEYAKGHFTAGSVLLAVGGFFMVRRLAPIYPDIAASGAGDNWWPVLLIVAGILILGSIFFRKPCRGGWYDNCRHGNRRGGYDDNRRDHGWHGHGKRVSGVIDIEVIFGGCEQVYLDPEFRGGKISSVFGGVKLDLRRTTLPEGETWLRIESVFGGVEIDTPEDWLIEIRGESIFGGFDDRRLPPRDGKYVEGRKLIVKTSNVFGGGEIK
jgi:hypothetical protein